MVWYVILFSVLAVLLVVAGGTAIARYRAGGDRVETSPTTDAQRRQRKAKRTQSKQARRKR